jgi:hypothetical protein
MGTKIHVPRLATHIYYRLLHSQRTKMPIEGHYRFVLNSVSLKRELRVSSHHCLTQTDKLITEKFPIIPKCFLHRFFLGNICGHRSDLVHTSGNHSKDILQS